MAIAVIMPKAGMSMEEGTIVKWYKSEGATVKQGEAILEITTDKVNMDVEAETSGTLIKIVGKEGEVLPVFTEIAYIGQAGEKIEVENQKNNLRELKEEIVPKKLIEEHKESVNEVCEGRIRATPAARKIARDQKIDLNQIRGKGPKGRIQKDDVIQYVNNIDRVEEKIKGTRLAHKIAVIEGVDLQNVKGSGYKGKIVKQDVLNSLHQEDKHSCDIIVEKNQEGLSGKLIPLDNMRKVISQRMNDSYFIAPTVTLNTEVDVSNLKRMRATLKECVYEKTNKKLTLTDFIILAVGKTLRNHPIINGTYREDGLFIYDDINIALAVGLENGLLVPVLRNVDEMKLTDVVNHSKDIVERAIKMKLSPDEQIGSTFTISNMGMFGITHFNPIINQPNSAILGVGAISDRFIPSEDGSPILKSIMTLSLTIDHRIIDGTPGAIFLRDLKKLLENPAEIMI